jgi:hypothetical protein
MAREEGVGLQEEGGCGDIASIWRVALPQDETRCCRYTSPVLNFLQEETEALTGSNKITSLLIW